MASAFAVKGTVRKERENKRGSFFLSHSRLEFSRGPRAERRGRERPPPISFEKCMKDLKVLGHRSQLSEPRSETIIRSLVPFDVLL